MFVNQTLKKRPFACVRVQVFCIISFCLVLECCFCKEGHNPELGNYFQDKDANLAAHQFCLVITLNT